MARPTGKPRLARVRREEIEQLAGAVVEARCNDLPVDPAAVAEANGITLSFNDYGDAFDALLEHQAGRFHIYCNTTRTGPADGPRARFSLAHELGHYYLDAHRMALVAASAHGSDCQYESALLVEREADLFAANLLMPADQYSKRARQAPPGLEGVRSLADRFGVSLTAAAIRTAQLETWPCAVIKWDHTGRAWKHVSTSLFAVRLGDTVLSSGQLPDGSPTRQALSGDDPGPHGFFQAGTVGSAWFPAVGAGDFRDMVFLEQAVSLGRWGALTILRPLDRLR